MKKNEMKRKYVAPKTYAVFVSPGSILAGSGETTDTEFNVNPENSTGEQNSKGFNWDNGLWDDESID